MPASEASQLEAIEVTDVLVNELRSGCRCRADAVTLELFEHQLVVAVNQGRPLTDLCRHELVGGTDAVDFEPGACSREPLVNVTDVLDALGL